ncbi:WD40-repeat-containing domain protein [Mycena vitilis]|nr:WD40-repeat-containing domain protein [Mycena vitilis]
MICTDILKPLMDLTDDTLEPGRRARIERLSSDLEVLCGVKRHWSRCLSAIHTIGSSRSAAYSFSGTQIAVGTYNDQVHIWDATSASLLMSLDHPGPVTSVAFVLGDTCLLSGSNDSSLKLWHLISNSLIRNYEGHSQSIVCVSQLFTHPPYFVSASLDHTIRIWDPTATTCVRVIACDDLLSAAVHSQSHLILSGSADGVASAWNYSDGSQLWHIRTGTSALTSVTIDCAGSRFAVGCEGCSVHIYDVRHQELLQSLRPPNIAWISNDEEREGIRSLKFDPHDKYIAFTGKGVRDVSLMDCVSGEVILNIRHQPMELIFSPLINAEGVATGSLELLATASSDGTCRLWDLSDLSASDLFTPDDISPDHEGWISSLAFSPDISRLATGGDHLDRRIRLWDARTGKHLTLLTGHEWGIYSLVFSLDSQLLASGSGDGTARIWNVETFQQLFVFSHSPQDVIIDMEFQKEQLITRSNNTTYTWTFDLDETPGPRQPSVIDIPADLTKEQNKAPNNAGLGPQQWPILRYE